MNKSHDFPGPTDAAPVGISVQILGSLQVRRGSEILDAHHLGGRKPRQILEILLFNLGTAVSKSRLIDILWAGFPPPEAKATLESHISVLRRHLQPGAGRLGPLKTTSGGYLMDPTLVDLDLARFDALVRRASSSADPLPLLEEAIDLADEPLFGDELLVVWAAEERAAHAERVRDVTIRAAKAALAGGRADDAVRWARTVVDGNRLCEAGWTVLVESLERVGRFAEGLVAYDECRQVLVSELGCSPGPALRATHLRLLQATTDGDDVLTDVLSALLLLNDYLTHRGATASTGAAPVELVTQTQGPLTQARAVIDSFLQRTAAA